MSQYTVHLRYYVGDPLEEIREEALRDMAQAHGVNASFQRIDNRTYGDGMMREETLNKTMDEITQDIITVTSDDEKKLRQVLAAIYGKYRSPRTPYSFWGSCREGERIAKEVADETGGGW